MTYPEKPQYIASYETFGLGLFLHWGLYSQMGAGEWIMHHHNIPRSEYRKLAATFTASKFDADAIVRLAKANGIRYICLTTRHHDGFSLYDTRGLSTFDAPHSAAGRDLIKEYADACHAHDMPMFFYHTTLDWMVETFDTDWDAYLQYLRNSVEILCKHYGNVAGFWFDGNWSRPGRDWQEDYLYELIRKYRPECIIVNNTGLGARGATGNPHIDVLTFEQGRPGPIDRSDTAKYQACEMCETISSHWGAAALDLTHKNPAQLIETLAACRRYGANLLLNIGPNAEGDIPDYEAAVIQTIGRWIATCGTGIYEGEPSELVCRSSNFVLKVGSEYHCYVHNLSIQGNTHLLKGEASDGWLTISGDLPPIKSVHWLDNNEPLRFSQDRANGLLAFEASPYAYGNNLVVRTAVLNTESSTG